jgi:hypothetical protein
MGVRVGRGPRRLACVRRVLVSPLKAVYRTPPLILSSNLARRAPPSSILHPNRSTPPPTGVSSPGDALNPFVQTRASVFPPPQPSSSRYAVGDQLQVALSSRRAGDWRPAPPVTGDEEGDGDRERICGAVGTGRRAAERGEAGAGTGPLATRVRLQLLQFV